MYDDNGNRKSLTATGADAYVTSYNYDASNRLLTETKTGSTKVETTTYRYDPNGNTISKLSEEVAANAGESAAVLTQSIAKGEISQYNGFNQLVETWGGSTVTYEYYPNGLRASKTVAGTKTEFLLDGGNVIAELQNGAVTAKYIRAMNLIYSDIGGEARYYLYNAHGDVVQLTNTSGSVVKTYIYDAFGVEKAPDDSDTNPFRYCGEYYDAETDTYYLRARYYDPVIGRFTQEDTHWNTSNMVYGDNSVKWNERDENDPLSLNAYTMVPEIYSIRQSGNLYTYCVNNPIAFIDITGEFISTIIGGIIGAVVGGISAVITGQNVGYSALAGAVAGAISGLGVDLAVVSGGALAFLVPVSGAVGGILGNVINQLGNGTMLGDVDWASALISGGIGAAFNAASLGLTTLVNGAFGLTTIGRTFFEKLTNALLTVGVADTLISILYATIFISLPQSLVEEIIADCKG